MTEFGKGRFHGRKFLRFLEEPTIQERNQYVWQGRFARTDGPDPRSPLFIRSRTFALNLSHHLRDLVGVAFNHNASSVWSLDMGCCHGAISIYSMPRIIMHMGIWIKRRQLVSRKTRSEEHTSELQSLAYLVCRLLLEKKNGPLRSPQRSGRGHAGKVRRSARP